MPDTKWTHRRDSRNSAVDDGLSVPQFSIHIVSKRTCIRMARIVISCQLGQLSNNIFSLFFPFQSFQLKPFANMGLLSLLREFAVTTSLHGIGFVVQTKLSVTTRVSWAIFFTIAVICASLQLRLAIICKFFNSRVLKGVSYPCTTVKGVEIIPEFPNFSSPLKN